MFVFFLVKVLESSNYESKYNICKYLDIHLFINIHKFQSEIHMYINYL